jgi:hypothetical protein
MLVSPILVRAYVCQLHRSGGVTVSKGGSNLAFLSWQALGCLRERGTAELFETGDKAYGIVVGCGMTGVLMRESIKHIGSGVHFAAANLVCIGTLREANHNRFYDVLTILPRDDVEPAQRAQGDAIAKMFGRAKLIQADTRTALRCCRSASKITSRAR